MSTTFTFSGTFPGPSSATRDSDNSSGGMQRGASYFFGFLITFVVLLFTFAGCGILSRRRFAAQRRARFEWNLEPWAERMEGGDVGYNPPLLMEKSWARAEDGSLWKDMTPLAAIIIPPDNELNSKQVSDAGPLSTDRARNPTGPYERRNNITTPAMTTLSSVPRTHSTSSTSQSSALTQELPYVQNPNDLITPRGGEEDTRRQQERSVPSHGIFHYLVPTSWLGSSRRRERGQTEYNGYDVEHGTQNSGYIQKSGENRDEAKQEEMLQVVVMIEMPSPRASSPCSASRRSHTSGYEIGVAQLPWQVPVIKTQEVVAHGHMH